MTTFELYLTLGFEHISDLAAYDHILFLTALSAVYGIQQWKRVLILVTAPVSIAEFRIRRIRPYTEFSNGNGC